MSGLSVQTTDLQVRYGATTALDAVTLTWQANRIHGLLGRNGAGKSTLLAALASLRQPTGGSVRIDGRDPFENESLMERVCLIRESGDMLTDESIETNLDFQETLRPSFDRGYADELLAKFRLDVDTKISSLSRGQASAFGVTAGLASRAPVTMFDEVHLGMDAHARQLFYEEMLADFAENPRTFIVSSHLISEIETMLETVTILDRGGLLLTGEADDVRAGGVTLTGPRATVTAAIQGRKVIGRRELGPTLQVTLFGGFERQDEASARDAGIDVGAVPLQDLFIHLTNDQTDDETDDTASAEREDA